jgi:hypothetical protein
MNERDSSGLPLRAGIMLLLFLGFVFLLVGFKALQHSGGAAPGNEAVPSVTASSAASPTSTPASAKADVRVYNIGTVEGAAENAANKLREAGWNITETGNLSLDDVPATTVYYGDTPGERESAEAVGKVLDAPAVARIPALAGQPKGVIVVVTG